MVTYQATQYTKPNFGWHNFDAQEVDGVLYFTVDLGSKGKQRWKSDGISTVFVASI